MKAATGLFLPLTELEQARIATAARAAGFPLSPEGVAAWAVSMASREPASGMVAGVLRGTVTFAKENPQIMRDALTIGRGILSLRR